MRTHRLPLLALPALAALLAGCGGAGHSQALAATSSATVSDTPTSAPPATTSSAPPTTTSAITPPSSAPATAAGPPACRTASLTVSTGRPDGTAGHNYVPLRFTNKGTAACLLTGFPGVSYVAGTDHHQVGKAADRDTSRSVVPVTLAAGATATATLTETDIGVYSPSQCQPTRVDALRIYPPGETHPALVPLASGAMGCAAPNLNVLRIAPIGS